MINKKQLAAFIIALLILIGFIVLGFRTSTVPDKTTPTTTTEPASNPSQEVDKVSVHEKNQYYTIDAVYPKTNSDAVTAYFKAYVDDQVTQFKDDTSWVNDTPSAAEGMLTLDISYEAVQSATVQNYIFSANSYTGGAHGMQVRKTFSFDKEGQLLTLPSLFTNGADGLTTLAALAQKELMKRDGAQADWIKDGAGAKEENYRTFVVTDEGITVLFDPYQVAPYSDGSIDIKIPVASFRSIANPSIFPVTH